MVNVINQSGEWLQPTDQNKTLNLERKTMTGFEGTPGANDPGIDGGQKIAIRLEPVGNKVF